MKNYIILLFILCMSFISCSKSDNQLFYIMENKDKVTKFILSRDFYINQLKGVEHLNLINEQEIYYKERVKYFVEILNGNNESIKHFREIQSKYYNQFPDSQKYYFYWSRDIIDQRIYESLKSNFGNVVYPTDFILEYNHGMVKIWEGFNSE